MRGLITGGGHGTRLRPITYTRNKHLIKIANKPLIFYAIENLRKAGVKDLGIVIRKEDNIIRKVVGAGKRWGCKITFIPQEKPLGLGHVVKLAKDFIGKEQFVFYLGDNIIRGGIRKYVEEFNSLETNCHLLLTEVKNPQAFGVPVFDKKTQKRIINIEEKPRRPKSNYAVSGIYFYDQSVFKAANKIKPSDRGELEISDIHTYLIKHNFKVTYSIIKGWWKDTGRPEDLLEANSLILNEIDFENKGSVDNKSKLIGNIRIEKKSRVINSKIIGPAVIGNNSIVENSFIGPFTSISDYCQIKNSEVEMSIIGSYSRLINLKRRVQESLIGENVYITCKDRKPQIDQFIVGDQSTLTLS